MWKGYPYFSSLLAPVTSAAPYKLTIWSTASLTSLH